MKIVKFTAILLVCCIAVGLCGCSKNTGEKKIKGAQYFEYEMELPEGVEADCIADMGTDSEGHLRLLAYNREKIEVCIYQEGKWKQKKLEVFEKDSVQQVMGCFYGEDDRLYFFAKDLSGKSPFVVCRSSNGKDYEQIRLEQYPKDEFNACVAYKYGATAQGDIVIYFQNRPGIYVYDRTGKLINRITKDLEPTVCGSTIYGTDTYYGYLKRYYDVEKDCKSELVGDTPKIVYGVTEDTDGNLYYVDSLGIHKRRDGGSAKQLLADGKLGQMSGTTCTVADMAVTGNLVYILYSQSDVGARLCEYRYEERELEDTKELSIYSFTENNTIEQAVRQFNREHPCYNIQYTWGMNDDTDSSILEETEKLTTELTQGSGPDILVLDNIRSDYYAKQGFLWRLDDWLEEKTKGGEFYDNILTAEEYEGNHYVVPMKFGVAFGFGTEKYGDNAQQIAKVIQKNKAEEFLLGTVTCGQCAAFFLRKDYVPAKKSALIRELKAIKVITEHSRTVDDCNMPVLFHAKQDNSVVSYDDAVFAEQQVFDALKEARQQYFCGEIKNLYVAATYQQAAENNGTKLVNMENVFYPHCRVAVSENAKDKELALKFLDCLLSDEVQRDSGLDGFAVNKAAVKYSMQKFKQNQDENGSTLLMIVGNGTSSYEVEAYTRKEAEELLSGFGKLDHCVVNDAQYYQILADEAKPYLENKISVEQAVERMLKKTGEIQK